jgi:8-oxo-dGTP pyrophosphatase MutT (NUDIX family)
MKQKYKVFLNERYIEISTGDNITLNSSGKGLGAKPSTDDVRAWFNSFVSGDLKGVTLFHPDPERFFLDAFKPAFKFIQAAGGVVLSGERILFIFRWGVWDLPKGKTDRKETPEEAALREVEEECGIKGHEIVKALPSTFHIYQSPYPGDKDTWILKETFWFEMKYEGNMEGTPQTDEGITEIEWVPLTDLNRVMDNTYENLKQIISLYR